jgi:hypothetical protein
MGAAIARSREAIEEAARALSAAFGAPGPTPPRGRGGYAS